MEKKTIFIKSYIEEEQNKIFKDIITPKHSSIWRHSITHRLFYVHTLTMEEITFQMFVCYSELESDLQYPLMTSLKNWNQTIEINGEFIRLLIPLLDKEILELLNNYN